MARDRGKRCEHCGGRFFRHLGKNGKKPESPRAYAVRKNCGRRCAKDAMLSKRHRELQSEGKIPAGPVRRIKRRA